MHQVQEVHAWSFLHTVPFKRVAPAVVCVDRWKVQSVQGKAKSTVRITVVPAGWTAFAKGGHHRYDYRPLPQ